MLSFTKGAVICRQGEPGGSVFIVSSGQVEIVLEQEEGDTPLAVLSPGEFFGELAILDGQPRSATARAASSSTCLVLHRAPFFRILHDPNVLDNLLAVMAQRVRAADQLIGAGSIDNRKLQEEVLTDPLTGLGNRRKLHRDISILEARARRYGHCFALAMCDIDNFKLYNDIYGHGKGDEALRTVAQTMAHNCRAGDEVYRYGGEEFVVVMPAQSADWASIGIERVRKSLQALAVPHTGNAPSNVLTFSAGLALISQQTPAGTRETLERADKALYQAKRQGRNRVVIAPSR